MSQEEPESTEAVTAANIQRLDAGYFEHMESLRRQVPVGEYIAESETNRLALLAMAGASLVMLVLFPLTMFKAYTFIVTVTWLAGFVIFGKLFYERVIVPNEAADSWRD